MSFRSLFSRGSGTTIPDLKKCLRRMDKLEVIHEGWMTKRGKVRKNWKKRYFLLLAPGCMIYMADDSLVEELKAYRGGRDPEVARKTAEMAVSKGVLGSVFIESPSQVSVCEEAVDGREHVLSIMAPASAASSRQFFFACETAGELQLWHERIQFMDDFEERQVRKEEQLKQQKEEARRRRIREKYLALLPSAKDMYEGGKVTFGDVVWTYTDGGKGDEHPDVVEQVSGPHAGHRLEWNGTIISDGQVALMGREDSGWGLWNGKRLEWRSPACLDRRGRGQCWEYRADAKWKVFTASEFTERMRFPLVWTLTSPTRLVSSGDDSQLDIPAEVHIEGSVPPMVAIACAMYAASRKEALYQVRVLHELQSLNRKKKLKTGE